MSHVFFFQIFICKWCFSAWGEGTFLAIQTAIIAALVLHYGGAPVKATIFLATYVGLVSSLVGGYTPKDVLWMMQAVNIPIILVAKVSFTITLSLFWLNIWLIYIGE